MHCSLYRGVTSAVGSPDKDAVTKPSLAFPPAADFFFGNSTIPDSQSYRKTVSGSFYIQSLCEVFEQHADDKNFMDMVQEVNNKIKTNPELSQFCDGGKSWQMSEIVTTLCGNIYFNVPNKNRRRKKEGMCVCVLTIDQVNVISNKSLWTCFIHTSHHRNQGWGNGNCTN